MSKPHHLLRCLLAATAVAVAAHVAPAAEIGEVRTMTNVAETYAQLDGASNVAPTGLTIAASDDIQPGSVVSVTSVSLAARTTTLQKPYLILTDIAGNTHASTSSSIAETTFSIGGADQVGGMITYVFEDGVDVQVGRAATCAACASEEGTASEGANLYLFPNVSAPAFASNYTARNYDLTYTVVYTVVSLAGGPYECTVEDGVETWNRPLEALTGSDYIIYHGNGVVALPADYTAAGGITVEEGVTVTGIQGENVANISGAGTIRFTEPATTLPFQGTAFTRKVEIANTIVANPEVENGRLVVFGSKAYRLVDGADITAAGLTIGNQGQVTQTFVQDGGRVTANGTTPASSTSTAFLLGHWPSTCSWTINAGELNVPNVPIRLGWDGTGNLIVNGGTVTAPGFRGGTGDGHSGAGNLTVANEGLVEIADSGIAFGNTGRVYLNGGTLKATATASVTGAEVKLNDAEATVEVAADATLTFVAPVSGEGTLVKAGAGTVDLKTSRPTVKLAAGSLQLTTTTEEAVSGIVRLPWAGETVPAADAIAVVNGSGTAFATTGASIEDGCLVIALDVNPAITASGNISELIPEGTVGRVTVNGENAEDPIEIVFDAIPEGVTEVVIVGTVVVSGTLTEQVVFADGATIVTASDMTIANANATAVFKVTAGTLKLTGTNPARVIVLEGGTHDVNGRADISYPITLKGGTLANTGAAIGWGTKQYWQVTLEADSFYDCTGEFGIVASGWGDATLNLNGHRLTKVGAAQLDLSNVTFAGGGELVVSEGHARLYNGCEIPSGTTLTLTVAEEATMTLERAEGKEIDKNGTLNLAIAGTLTVASGLNLAPNGLSGEGTVSLTGGTLTLGSRSGVTTKIVAASGTSTLAWTGDNAQKFCSVDSAEDPIVTVNADATLKIDGKDFSGWNGELGDTGWFVNNGTVVFAAGSGSRFWREHVVLADGSTVKIDNGGRNVLLYGGAGSEDAAHFNLAEGSASIVVGDTAGDNAALFLGNDGAGGYGTHGAGFSVGEGAVLTVEVPVKGGDPIAKHGAGTLVLTGDMSAYTGTITLNAGTVKSTADLGEKIASGNPSLDVIATTEGDYNVYSIAREEPTEVFPKTDGTLVLVKDGADVPTELIDDDVVVYDSHWTSPWGGGPDITGWGDHVVALNREMDFGKDGGIAEDMNLELRWVGGANQGCYFHGATIGANAVISGDGTLYVGHTVGTVTIADGVSIDCGFGFQTGNAWTAVIAGDVAIMGAVYVNDGVFKLAEGASLFVAEKLPAGAVKTDVAGKKVVFDEDETTYRLADGADEPTVDEGSIEPVEGEENVFAIVPAEGQTTVAVENLPEGATVRVPTAIREITGVADADVRVMAANADITGAFSVSSGVIALNREGSVAGVPVEPTLVATAESPAFTVEDENGDTAVTVKSIPGLVYRLLGTETLGTEMEAVGEPVVGTGSPIVVTGKIDEASSAFFRVSVDVE